MKILLDAIATFLLFGTLFVAVLNGYQVLSFLLIVAIILVLVIFYTQLENKEKKDSP